RTGADDHHLHASGEYADAGRQYQSGAYGRGADRHAGLRPDHAALRTRAVDGLEIRRRAILQSAARGVADLRRISGHYRLCHLFSQGRVMAAEAGHPRFGRLLQESERAGIYLSARWAPSCARSPRLWSFAVAWRLAPGSPWTIRSRSATRRSLAFSTGTSRSAK